jgi:hypothetical protein
MYEGAVKPTSIEQVEHIEVNGVPAKRVLVSGYDGVNLQDILVDSTGVIYTTDKDGMLIPRHNKIVVDESSAPANTVITYYLANVERGTKTITVDGTTTTIEMTYAE